MAAEWAELFEDAHLQSLITVADREFTGTGPGGATVVVDGALNVRSADVGRDDLPQVAGFHLVAALNQALDESSAATQATLTAMADLPEEVRRGLQGELEVESPETETPELPEQYEGSSDDQRVVVHVTANPLRVLDCYMEDLSDEVVAQVPLAVNRAIGAAMTSDEEGTPLVEQLEASMTELDDKLGDLSAELDRIDDQVAAFLRPNK